MKIIEALKMIKHLDRKTEKNRQRISDWASYIELVEENATDPKEPLYNAEDVRIMIQQIGDWQAEKANLRRFLHKTNTIVSVEFDGKKYTIDGLLLLQNIVLPSKLDAQKRLTRQRIVNPAKQRVIMQYNPKEREKEIDKIEDTLARLNSLLDSLSLSVDVVTD